MRHLSNLRETKLREGEANKTQADSKTSKAGLARAGDNKAALASLLASAGLAAPAGAKKTAQPAAKGTGGHALTPQGFMASLAELAKQRGMDITKPEVLAQIAHKQKEKEKPKGTALKDGEVAKALVKGLTAAANAAPVVLPNGERVKPVVLGADTKENLRQKLRMLQKKQAAQAAHATPAAPQKQNPNLTASPNASVGNLGSGSAATLDISKLKAVLIVCQK